MRRADHDHPQLSRGSRVIERVNVTAGTTNRTSQPDRSSTMSTTGRFRRALTASAFCAGFALFAASSAWAIPPMIGRASIDGSNADYGFIAADAPWLAVDSGHVYWTN